MNGSVIADAASVLVTAGAQIDALLDLTVKGLNEKISELSLVSRVNVGDYQVASDNGSWITTSVLKNISIYGKRAKKPTAYIAIEVVIFDEQEMLIEGWEPSIYIKCIKDKNREQFDNLEWRLSEVKNEGLSVSSKDSRLWCYKEDGEEDYDWWFYVVPLVQINSPEDINSTLVNPVIKLLNDDYVDLFEASKPVFGYTMAEEDGVSVKKMDLSIPGNDIV